MRITFFLILLLTSFDLYSQQADSKGYAHALKLSNILGDSLDLSAAQKDSIYSISMALFAEQYAVREKYKTSDSLQLLLQKIENKRDALYKPILGSDKYTLYKRKKVAFLTMN